MTEIRVISSDCAWPDEDDQLATKLITGYTGERSKERFFSEHPDCKPDFDMVLRILRAEESAKKGVKQLKNAGKGEDLGELQTVQAVSKEKPFYANNEHDDPKCLACGRT